MSGATICICGGIFTMCEDGHAIDCPASNQFDRYKAMMGGPAACLTTPPARSYADEIANFRPQMDDCENALRPGLTWLEGWYDVEGFVAAIRLLSQGGKA